MFKHRILHIENDDDFRILLDRALRRAGLDIDFHVVDDADAFERALTEGAIDLVLSDWNVPGFSAQAALLSLRQRDPSTPFIILSGAPKEADPSLAAGAAAWLDKGDLEGAAQALSRFLSPQPPTVDGSPATTPGADHPSVRVD